MATIPTSGPISFTDIQAVMGGTGPVSLQDYRKSASTRFTRGVPGVGDTNLDLTTFKGKGKALLDGLQYRIFRRQYLFAIGAGGAAGTGLFAGGGGAGGVTASQSIYLQAAVAQGPTSSATAAAGTTSGGAGTGFGAGGGGTGTVKARYLYFSYGNGNGGVGRNLNLGGLNVYSSFGGSNIITSTMTVTASSNLDSVLYPNSALVDGDINTFCHSATTADPWFKVDLGSEQFIHRVELQNRYDCCRSRIAGLTIALQDTNGAAIYTSGLITLSDGSTVYREGMDGYLYYTIWPSVNTTPYGSDTLPYPTVPFGAGQGGSGFAYIQLPKIGDGALKARYLTFEYGNANSGAGRYLQSSGVKVYSSPSGSNLITPTMTVTALSVLNSSWQTSHMVDNNDATTYISTYIEYPWVKVDLGLERDIHRVELMNRSDVAKARLAGIRLVLSDTNNNIIYTSGLVLNKSGSSIYQDGENAFMYYTFWPAITPTPYGSDSVPYPVTPLEYFTNSSTSYTFTSAGTARLLLMGGGGGGGTNAGAGSRGAGGGGAGYLQSYFVPVTNGTVATITVGGAGVADTDGGTTSVAINGVTYSAAGGGNGSGNQYGGAGSSSGGTGGSSGGVTAGSSGGATQTSTTSQGATVVTNHIMNGGGYFADDPTWFESRTENYSTGLVTDFTSINAATGGIVPNDASWETYSVEWFGYFYAPTTGSYTFYTESDDASYLWIGSNALSGYTTVNALVNNGSTHGIPTASGTISLVADTYYPIRIQMGENYGGDNIYVSFTGPSIARTYNLAGYVFYGIGNYTTFPAPNARLLKAVYPTNVDKMYYINVAGTASPTYCLMNSKWDGGGWMMMMKATRGTTFNYNSTYWTDAGTTLNPTDTTRTDADAKFPVMNSAPIKDILALWPDVGSTGGSISQTESWSWLIKDYFYGGTRVNAMTGLSSTNSRDATTHFLNTSEPSNFPGFSSSIWSSQTPSRRTVLGGTAHLNNGFGAPSAYIRFGFAWNENELNNFASMDAIGGIGLQIWKDTVNSGYLLSAGDITTCCATVGLNRTMRVELFGR